MRRPKAAFIAFLLPLAVLLSSMASPAKDAGRVEGPGAPSADDWPTFRGDGRRTGFSASRAPRAPELLWAVRIPTAGDLWSYLFGPSTGGVNDVNCASSPAVLGDLWFAATGDQSGSGRLHCFDRRSGAMHYRTDGARVWRSVRTFGLTVPDEVVVGVHAQAPFVAGCRVVFSRFAIEPRAVRDFRSGE